MKRLTSMIQTQDCADVLAGYWPSVWPVECGGNRRQKAIRGPGLDLRPAERLCSTIRDTGRWNVMFVQREPGQLYLQGTTCVRQPDVFGWVERVDPVTLQPLRSSGPLRTGGHEWCGAVVVHSNGDLYTVNGSFLHRLDPECEVLLERALPTDWAHNGLLVLSDGSIATKDLRLSEQTTLVILDPDRLNVVAQTTVPEPSMGRIAADETDDGTFIYLAGRERLFRYRWAHGRLEFDYDWQPVYRSDAAGTQGLAWDVSLVDGHVWLQDNGDTLGVRAIFSNHPNGRARVADERPVPLRPAPWTGPQRVLRVSATDASDIAVLEPFGEPGGWVLAPPLVHDGIVVTWDSCHARLAAFKNDGATFERLWERPFRQVIQPIIYPQTRELIVNDERKCDDHLEDDVVVLDLDTGREKGRVHAGGRANGMFLCPGWERDLYYCTWFKVARVSVKP